MFLFSLNTMIVFNFLGNNSHYIAGIESLPNEGMFYSDDFYKSQVDVYLILTVSDLLFIFFHRPIT